MGISTLDRLKGVKKKDYAAEMAKPNDFTPSNIIGKMTENKDALGITQRAKQAPESGTAVDKYMAGNAIGQKGAGAVETATSDNAEDSLDKQHAQRVKNLQDIINAGKAKEEEEKKKHKTRQIINAVGDGLSALANLYFTTKGAPNAHNPNNSLMDKSEAWYQKMRNQRLKDGDRALAYQKNLDDLEAAYEQEKWNRAYKGQVLEQRERESKRRQAGIDTQKAIENKRADKKLAIDLENAKSNRIRANKTGTARPAAKEEKEEEKGPKKPTGGAWYVGADGLSYHIPVEKYNVGFLQKFYNALPKDYRSNAFSIDHVPDKRSTMIDAINNYISRTKHHGFSKELWEALGKPKGWGNNGQVGGDDDNNLHLMDNNNDENNLGIV